MSKKIISAVENAGYFDDGKNLFYGIFTYDSTSDEENFVKYGRYIGIEKVFRDDNGITYLNIDFDDLDGTTKNFVIERSILGDKKELQRQLLAKGADVHAKSIDILLKCFANTEADIETISACHSKTGWIRETNAFSYKGQRLISSKKEKSQYIGIYDLTTKGTFKGWQKVVSNYILGCTPMEVAILIGLSPLVSSLIDDCRLIFHLMGDSSKGKTTAGVAAVSVAGCPNPNETVKKRGLKGKTLHSLMTTWNGTDNAIPRMLADLDGTIIVLDELSKLSSNSELAKILYTFSDGIDKNRNIKARELDDTSVFQTNVLSIGEESLIDKAKNANTGLRMRVLELRTEFTKSAKHSADIKSGFYANYGFAVPKVAKYMVSIGLENIHKIYYKWHAKYLNALVKAGDESESSHRLAAFGGVLLATAEIATQALNIDFNINEIQKFLIEQMMKDCNERNVGKRAHDALWSFIIEHIANFVNDKKLTWNKNIPCYGRIDDCKIIEGKEVSFKREKFNEIMHSLNFNNPSVIIDDFKARGLLNCENGKKYRKRKILSTDRVEAVYSVIFPEND